MSARAAFSRESLTTEMSVGGSMLVVALATGEALRPKMVFTRERSWLRCHKKILDKFGKLLYCLNYSLI